MGDEMNFTMREKAMLVMFGCGNRKMVYQRLGLACICIYRCFVKGGSK